MFHGSIVALLTPFTEAGEVDFPAFEKLLDFHVDAGTNALVIAGTTGESATLEQDEFERLLELAVSRVGGGVPVIAGTGSASTSHAIRQSRRAEALGASAVLVVTPYYNRPMQAGLAAHFKAVADAVSVPLIMYNVPSRTSVDLAPETAVELAQHPGIAGLKDAVPDMARIEYIVSRCGPDFAVLSGDDPTCLAAMRAGAWGVVSVAANVAPRLMRELCDAARVGDWRRAERLNDRLAKLYETLGVETNPIPVKWAAFEMGLAGPWVRLPLTPLAERHRGPVRDCLEELEISTVRH